MRVVWDVSTFSKMFSHPKIPTGLCRPQGRRGCHAGDVMRSLPRAHDVMRLTTRKKTLKKSYTDRCTRENCIGPIFLHQPDTQLSLTERLVRYFYFFRRRSQNGGSMFRVSPFILSILDTKIAFLKFGCQPPREIDPRFARVSIQIQNSL